MVRLVVKTEERFNRVLEAAHPANGSAPAKTIDRCEASHESISIR
jgi:hypothetical protein